MIASILIFHTFLTSKQMIPMQIIHQSKSMFNLEQEPDQNVERLRTLRRKISFLPLLTVGQNFGGKAEERGYQDILQDKGYKILKHQIYAKRDYESVYEILVKLHSSKFFLLVYTDSCGGKSGRCWNVCLHSKQFTWHIS